MKTLRLIMIVIPACVLGLAAGLYLGSERSPGRQTEEKKADKSLYGKGLFELSSAQKEALGLKIASVELRIPEERLRVTGKVVANPDRAVAVSPRTPGRVVKVLAQLGEKVDAGAVLARLDSAETADALAELAQAESALSLAQSRADQEKQLYDSKLQVLEMARKRESSAAAEAALSAVELGRPKQEYIGALARLELCRTNYERQKILVERKIGARKDLIEAEKNLIMARSELDAVAETIRLNARQDLLAAETSLQQARTQVNKVREKLRLLGFGEAALAESLKNISYSSPQFPLVAPFRGTVIECLISEGQLLEAGSVAFRLADLSTLWVLLDVAETAMARLRMGQEAAIEVDGEASAKKVGRITYIGDVVDDQTRTVKVRVELGNANRQLKPGMFATARINTGQSGNPVLMVPKSALFLLDEGPVVFVEEEKQIRFRPVEAGAQIDGWIVIQNGLKAGERIVTEGGFALKAQMLKSKLGEE